MASNKSVVSVVVALVIAAPLTGCSLNFQHLPSGAVCQESRTR